MNIVKKRVFFFSKDSDSYYLAFDRTERSRRYILFTNDTYTDSEKIEEGKKLSDTLYTLLKRWPMYETWREFSDNSIEFMAGYIRGVHEGLHTK